MKHYFEIEVAAAVGINAAVVFENIAFWILHNERQGKNRRDGVHWMYSTQKELAAQFDYLTEKQVRTAIDKLIGADYLRVGNYNRHGYDRTRWFAFGEKGEIIKRKGLTLAPEKADADTKAADGMDCEGEAIQNIKDFEKERLRSKMRRVAEMCGAVCTV